MCPPRADFLRALLTFTPCLVVFHSQELVPSELEEFCSDAGVRLGFVPADALLSPEHLHSTNDATFSPFSSTAPDPLRDGGMAEGEADELREKLNKLLGKEGGDA